MHACSSFLSLLFLFLSLSFDVAFSLYSLPFSLYILLSSSLFLSFSHSPLFSSLIFSTRPTKLIPDEFGVITPSSTPASLAPPSPLADVGDVFDSFGTGESKSATKDVKKRSATKPSPSPEKRSKTKNMPLKEVGTVKLAQATNAQLVLAKGDQSKKQCRRRNLMPVYAFSSLKSQLEN